MSRNNLFHGTDSEITDRVLPSNAVGKRTYVMQNNRKDRAYATGREATAWSFADHAAGTNAVPHREVIGRARVYAVHPHPEQQPGLYNTEHPTWKRRVRDNGHYEDHQEQTAPSFKVKDSIDIKPGHQGTFPHLNWNQFSKHPGTNDANHPDAEEVEHGHWGSSSRDQRWENTWGSSRKGGVGMKVDTGPGHQELPGQMRML